MAKQKILYSCTKCDAQFTAWSGRCLECQSWGTIQKEDETFTADTDAKADIQTLTASKDTKQKDKPLLPRLNTGIDELNNVFGETGIVPGSLILLGGEPGIGKSTIILQLCNNIKNTLYISGEESSEQVRMRLVRLQLNKNPIQFIATNHLKAITTHIKKVKPALVIIDSIQTIYNPEATGEMGSVNQIKACTSVLLEIAKKEDIPIIIIGHVTKDGTMAGPKTLEHLVDTVLYLEGDRYQQLRFLRPIKNRFGSTDEVGVFEMTSAGLKAVKNPSAFFLENIDKTIPGSVVTVINEGSRCFLVEIQSLLNKTVFGIPQRKASGYDNNRLQLLLAVLSKRLNMRLAEYDIYLNIIGGLKVKEVAVDLAICMSIISSYKDTILDKNSVAVGEVGLGGEVRPIPLIEKRIKEAEQLGFEKMYIPDTKIDTKKYKINLVKIKNIKDLVK